MRGTIKAHPAPIRLPARLAETGHRDGAETGGDDCEGADGETVMIHKIKVL